MVRAASFRPTTRSKKRPTKPPGGSYEPSSVSSVSLPVGRTVSVAPNAGKPRQTGRHANATPSRCGAMLSQSKSREYWTSTTAVEEPNAFTWSFGCVEKKCCTRSITTFSGARVRVLRTIRVICGYLLRGSKSPSCSTVSYVAIARRLRTNSRPGLQLNRRATRARGFEWSLSPRRPLGICRLRCVRSRTSSNSNRRPDDRG